MSVNEKEEGAREGRRERGREERHTCNCSFVGTMGNLKRIF